MEYVEVIVCSYGQNYAYCGEFYDWGESFVIVDVISLTEVTCYKSGFISGYVVFLIKFEFEYLFTGYRSAIFW